MLRSLFGETPRMDSDLLKEAMMAMDSYLEEIYKKIRETGDLDHFWREVEVWTVGLKTSLDELEQSVYASDKFAGRVSKHYEADMSEAERDDYYRYIYFYKNGFIRIFSLLDKIGTLLNAVLALETEKVKHRFSYFTVLRQLQFKGQYPDLERILTALKEEYGDVLQRLRTLRNMEIHHMNSEMRDDLWQRHRSLYENIKLENIQANMADLQQGVKMVYGVLIGVFCLLPR